MPVNQEPSNGASRVRFGAHWRLVSWSVLDKSLPVVFGLGFVLLVVRGLPPTEFGFLTIATAVAVTLAQLLKTFFLIPLVKFVAEGSGVRHVAATGAVLHATASVGLAFGLLVGRDLWSGLFGKPELAPALVASACWLVLGSVRDVALATLEGLRRLRAVFFLDLWYYGLAFSGFVAWRLSDGPRQADTVQWILAAAAGLGSLVAFVVTRPLLVVMPSRADAGRLVRFGRFTLGSGLGSTLYQHGDTLLAGVLMSPQGVAAYGAAKLLFRGFNVMAQAISQVLVPLVSRLQAVGRTQDLRVLYEKSTCFLHLGVLPIVLVLVVIARPLLDLLYGGRYGESVRTFQILVASALTLPFASVGSPFLIGLGRVRSLLGMTWAGLVLGLGLAMLWIPRFGPAGAASALLVASVLGMVLRTWWLRRILGFRLLGVAGRIRDAVAFVRRRLAPGQDAG